MSYRLPLGNEHTNDQDLYYAQWDDLILKVEAHIKGNTHTP